MIDFGVVLEYTFVVDSGDFGKIVSSHDETVEKDPEWLVLGAFPVKRYGVEGHKCIIKMH